MSLSNQMLYVANRRRLGAAAAAAVEEEPPIITAQQANTGKESATVISRCLHSPCLFVRVAMFGLRRAVSVLARRPAAVRHASAFAKGFPAIGLTSEQREIYDMYASARRKKKNQRRKSKMRNGGILGHTSSRGSLVAEEYR